MGDYLAAQGLTVHAPLLPGHGTRVSDLARTSWTQLVQASEQALDGLQNQCDQVFVAGLSMGGLLTLRLGQTRQGIAGLVPMAAAVYLNNPLRHFVPLAKYVLPTVPKAPPEKDDFQDMAAVDLLWSYDVFPLRGVHEVLKLRKAVLRDLAQIRAPLLILHGVHDAQVPKRAAQAIHDRVQAEDRTLVWLERSGHCVTVDAERESVWDTSWRWIRDRAQGHAVVQSGATEAETAG